VGEGGCLRAGKDGKGEELFCAGAGGGRVGWEVLKLLRRIWRLWAGAGDGLVDSSAASWVAWVWVWLGFVSGLKIRGQPFRRMQGISSTLQYLCGGFVWSYGCSINSKPQSWFPCRTQPSIPRPVVLPCPSTVVLVSLDQCHWHCTHPTSTTVKIFLGPYPSISPFRLRC
jgi:hypothetical protein